MRISHVLAAFSLLLIVGVAGMTAQPLSTLTTPLSTPDGTQTTIAELGQGKVTIVSYGATWCVPCKKEMAAVNELYPKMQEHDIEYIAVFIDNTKTMARVGPYVTSKGFLFPVLLDPNSEVFEAVNGTEVPYTLVYNAAGELKFKHDGYLEGDEEHLMEEAMSLVETSDDGGTAVDQIDS